MAIFLDQNGVLSMGDKTPVTILQETLQKRGITPHYELLYNRTGTFEPVFKYQVTAADLSAIGHGRTIKAAKHDAAAALLKRMQVHNALTESADIVGTEDVDIASLYTGAINRNFVGMLDEVCVINRVPNPVIIPVREEGPPHARVFTMQCKVSRITETAVARTKKQAKQLVCQQMIRRIEEILGDKYTPLPEIPVGDDIDDADGLYGETPNLKALECGDVKLDYTIPISNMHNAFFYRPDEFSLPKAFEDLSKESEEFYEKIENPKAFMENLVKELGGIIKTFPLTKRELIDALKDSDSQYDLRYGSNGVEDLSEEQNTDEKDEDESNVDQIVLEEFDFGVSDDSQYELGYGSNGVDHLSEEQNTDETDEDDSNVDQIVLEEFDFGVSEDVLCSPLSETIQKPEGRAEEETLISQVNECLTLHEDTNKPCCVFLSIQCTQGVWSFRGWGDNNEKATDAASVQAIKFFRLLSVPSENNSACEVISK